MKLRIDDATLVAPGNSWHRKTPSIGIENGRIAAIDNPDFRADTVIDGTDHHLSLGWLDLRAQFGDPGLEHKEDLASGCAAAAAGGFTDICLLPNTQPIVQTKNDIQYLKSGNRDRLTQIHPLGAVTLDTKGEEFTDMLDLHAAGAVAFTDGTQPIWHTDILLKTLLYLQKIDGLLMNRPEDRMLTTFATMHEGLQSTLLGMQGMPRLAETLVIKRDLEILRYTGGKLHFSNISTAEAVQLIAEAKAEGLQVTCDVAAYQLLWEDTAIVGYDTNYKVNPPLREEIDRKALLEGLRQGTIDSLVTSHNPQDQESKKLEFDLADYGMTGLEMFLPMMAHLGDALPMDVWVEKITATPRTLLSLHQPTLEVGSEASFTLFNTQKKWTYNRAACKSKGHNHPWYNQEVTGKVTACIRGEFVWHEEQLIHGA